MSEELIVNISDLEFDKLTFAKNTTSTVMFSKGEIQGRMGGLTKDVFTEVINTVLVGSVI